MPTPWVWLPDERAWRRDATWWQAVRWDTVREMLELAGYKNFRRAEEEADGLAYLADWPIPAPPAVVDAEQAASQYDAALGAGGGPPSSSLGARVTSLVAWGARLAPDASGSWAWRRVEGAWYKLLGVEGSTPAAAVSAGAPRAATRWAGGRFTAGLGEARWADSSEEETRVAAVYICPASGEASAAAWAEELARPPLARQLIAVCATAAEAKAARAKLPVPRVGDDCVCHVFAAEDLDSAVWRAPDQPAFSWPDTDDWDLRPAACPERSVADPAVAQLLGRVGAILCVAYPPRRRSSAPDVNWYHIVPERQEDPQPEQDEDEEAAMEAEA